MTPLLIIWLLFSPLIGYSPTPFVGRPEANEKIKAALKYHGTLDAYEISPDVWKFKRQGQACSLFTKSFEKAYEEKP